MTRDEFVELKSWFLDYTDGFSRNDPKNRRIFELKTAHTGRVCENIIDIGASIALSDSERILAETSALLHDIGRFKQYAEYGTFNDRNSANHATLGLEVLTEHDVLKRCSDDERHLITGAIACHNAACIPPHVSGRGLVLSQLLRDADKLDIWKVFVENYVESPDGPDRTITLGLPDDDSCSENVLDSLSQSRLVNIEDIRTFNDFKLFQISWVFDLNFPATFKLLRDRGHLKRLSDTLPSNADIFRAVDCAWRFVDQSICR